MSSLIKHLSFLPRCILCNTVLAIADPSIRLSVCPSVKRMNCDKTKESSAHILVPYEHASSLRHGRIGGGRLLLLSEILGQTDPPLPFINGDFYSIFAHSTSTVTPSKKSAIITKRISTTGFRMSIRCLMYVASKPPPCSTVSLQ